MWIPTTASEVEEAARAGSLVETPTFDAKAALPARKRNADLAVDVAAMTTEGGVLLYGVDQDEHGRPTVLSPIELAGARERVDQIVQTSIAEVPSVDARELPLENEPARGYLVVVVPRSARAPHQVIVGKEFRYYGRGATGNRLLTQGEVAMLYERRQRWEVDREALLDHVIAQAGFDPNDELIYSYGFAAPVAGPDELVEAAAAGDDVPGVLRDLLSAAAASGSKSYPDLRDATAVRRRGADGWILDNGVREDRVEPKHSAFIEVDRRGLVSFFCGRSGDTLDGRKMIFESAIAGNTAVTFALASRLYERAGFTGEVDVGVATTDLSGAHSYYVGRRGFYTGPGFGADSYRRSRRLSAADLARDPRAVVRDLYTHMFEITLPQGFDPFQPPP
jgi:hypothetical protein